MGDRVKLLLIGRIMADKENKTSKGQYLSIGLAIGLMFGLAMDNIPIGLCIGVAIGASYEGYYKNKNKKDKE